MNWKNIASNILALPLVLLLSLPLGGQADHRASDIIEKNIEAVAGKGEALTVKNISFKAGTSRYFVRPDGTMKVLTGLMDPVVVMATLITPEGVRQNALHNIRSIHGFEKARLQCLARLAGGLFSLKNFAGGVSYRERKAFGPERRHVLTAKTLGLTVTFDVDAETFLVKSMNLEAYSSEEGHFGFTYEFGPPLDVAGFRLPSAIFSAPVGAQTSLNPEPQPVSEVRFNAPVDEQFFANLDINMGGVVAEKGRLKGNVLGVNVINPLRPPLAVVTNWQQRHVEEAGFRTGDLLVLEAGGLESELTFRMPEDGSYPDPAANVMTMEPLRGSLYYLYFDMKDAEQAERLKARLAALLPIQVKKKDSSCFLTAGEVVAGYLRELGGVQNLRAWKGMKGSGRFVFQQPGAADVPVAFWFNTPNKQRMEMTVEGRKAIYATDGTRPWYCDPSRGAPVPTPLPEEQSRDANRNDDEYPFLDYESKGHRLELQGRELFEGREVFRVRLIRKNGMESIHFFDAATFREVRHLIPLKRGDADVIQEAVERDFRRVGWLLLPFEIEFKMNGRTLRTLVMDQIELTPAWDDSIFKMPEREK